MKKQIINPEFLKMQKVAGLITEGQYKTTLLILEDESIDEGLKDWLIKGLIVISTLAGVGKVYQMDQQYQKNQQAQMEYYNNVLSKEYNKMSEDDLFDLGSKIADETGGLKGNSSADADTYKKMVIDYAEDYIKANPSQFAVGADGGIYQLSSNSNS